MSVAAFVTSRVSSSSSRSLTLCSSRTSSTTRRKSTSSADIRCLSTSSSTSNQQNTHNGYDSSTSSPVFTKSILVGLSAAGAATIGASSLDFESKVNTTMAQCEPETTATSQPTSFYNSLGENLKTLLWFDQDKENLKIPLGRGGELRFEPSPTSSSAIPLPGRVIDAVKASVDTASEWEKKAKETVRMMTGQYPKIYDVSLFVLIATFIGIKVLFSNGEQYISRSQYVLSKATDLQWKINMLFMMMADLLQCSMDTVVHVCHLT